MGFVNVILPLAIAERHSQPPYLRATAEGGRPDADPRLQT